MRKLIKATKPAKPAPVVAVAPVAVAPVVAVAVKPAKPEPVRFGGFTLGNVNRTAATVVAQRTNFSGVTSDRDTAYLAQFERVRRDTAETPDGETITLASLAKLGKNPYYDRSAKPHDAGAINRAVKAGNVEHAADGASIKLTARGAALAAAAYSKLHSA
jgi:hypothetical protein